jgi:N-acetylneuraminate synthase
MKKKKINLVAEIGGNHKGNIEIAKKMIDTLSDFCKVKYVKFQKRNNKKLLSKKEYNSPHPNPENSYGKTYGKHREFLEFSKQKHSLLMKYCKKKKTEYSCSAWDIDSAKELTELKLEYIKIPSACNLDFEMITYLCKNFKGGIHISLGMTTLNEEKKIFNLVKKFKRTKDLVLYSCTSGYPVPIKDLNLLEIKRLKKKYGKYGCEIGFSGHYSGISVDNLAILLGATWIERHFTLDRTWKGTDHAASLEPDGMRRLQVNLNDSLNALNYKSKEILDIEKFQRKKLKRFI